MALGQVKPRCAIFLDRDGVINQNRSDYVKSWGEFEFLDDALSALARLADSEFKILIISNQSAIGRNIITREQVEDIHRRMLEQIRRAGGRIDRILYCPHRPDEHCDCRKPMPGLFIQAGRELDLDLTCSILVGDALGDIQAGRAVGCTTLLVKTGRGQEALAQLEHWEGEPPVIVEDLADAANWILRKRK